MAQPIYFLPDLRAAQCENVATRRSVLNERGLTDVFADVPMEQMPCFDCSGRGPGDKSGAILAYQTVAGEVPRRLGYYPQEQVWTPVGDGSLLWLGIDPSEPPKPEDLARRRQYPGYSVPCGDGERWMVPIIRRPDDSTNLPTDMTWDASGRFVEPIKPAYLKYWEESAEVSDWFYGGLEAGKLNNELALMRAIRAMSINYRFGRNEQAVLRTIDRESYLLILSATVDYPNADAYAPLLKKTNGEMSTPNITPGLPGGSPITDPAAATCG